MPEEVYAKYARRATGENCIALSDAEHIAIRDYLDNQLISFGISGIQQQLVQAVYRKTIRYNKREDDLCGSQLVDLISSDSSPSYCNRQIRELAKQSIIIARDGYYGRILSINFDFSQWGKTPEENGILQSDPETFAQAYCTAETTPENTPDHAPKNVEQETNATPDFSNNNALESRLENLQKTLFNEITHYLDTALNTLFPQSRIANLQHETEAQKPKTEHPNRQHFDLIPLDNTLKQASNDPHINAENSAETSTIPTIEKTKSEEKQTEENAIKVKAEPEKPQATEEKQAEENTIQREQKEPEQEKSETTTDNTENELIYPEALKPYEKNAISKALSAENIDNNDQQLLLNALSARFEISDWQPIKSPIAYFRSLIRSHKENQLVTDYAEALDEKQKAARQQQAEAEKKAQQSKSKEHYQQAAACYRQVALFASSLGCSLREMAIKYKWQDLIESMGFDLDAEPKAVLKAC